MFDSNVSQISSVPAIRQWEEAGANLASALSKYIDLCLLLGPSVQNNGTPSKTLAVQIDSALETFHAELEQRVFQSRSILAQTLNQVSSPIFCFSNEVLSEIFTYVIIDPINPSDPVSMKDSLVNTYRSLHNLLGVCSTWRHVALAHGSLWSIIPIIGPTDSNPSSNGPQKPLSTDLSLERSGNTDLHLAAIVSHGDRGVDMRKHAHRFRSMNIISKSTFAIGKLLSNVLSGSHLQVSKLSLGCESNAPFHQYPSSNPSFSLIKSTRQTNLEGLLQSLSEIRLSGILINWDRLKFSGRLVELELRSIHLSGDSKLISFLTSISSATELRTLKLIGVVTYLDSYVPGLIIDRPNIYLPKLKTIVIRNLYFDNIDSLLSSIASRSHQLTLHLTKRTFEIPFWVNARIEDAIPRMVNLLGRVTVNTLLLESFEDEEPWLSSMDIREMLNAMPDIESLRMHNWDFHTGLCETIQRPGLSEDFNFPWFKNIYLSRTRIRDAEAFKKTVASHFGSLERMELAEEVSQGSEIAGLFDFMEGDRPIVTWLRENVPNFILNSYEEVPVEFRPPVWELW